MNGIGNGAVYASLALALVLIFRTTGHPQLRAGRDGALLDVPRRGTSPTAGSPVWLAILVSMALSFVGGALIERVVIRPVEHSSPLVIVIVTIGLFLAINSIAQVHVRQRLNARCRRFYPHHIVAAGQRA